MNIQILDRIEREHQNKIINILPNNEEELYKLYEKKIYS